MKKDKSSLFEGTQEDLFSQAKNETMGSEVSDAAKILRNFVSPLSKAVEKKHENFFFVEGDQSDKKEDSVEAKESSLSQEEQESFDHYIESASEASIKLEQEKASIIPRILTPSQDGLLLAVATSNNAEVSGDIRLQYKGKASKKQLERLRRKIAGEAL